jgi:hypothetical protein
MHSGGRRPPLKERHVMDKKLMLVVTSALTAIAFAALPAAASAGEYLAHCQTGSDTVCTGSIQSTEIFETENTSGERFTCTSVTGTVTAIGGSPMGTAQLLFHGCREQNTIFKFTCSNTGTSGDVTTNTLVTELINTAAAPATIPGMLFTGWDATYTCPGFSAKKTVGSVIGILENSATDCGASRTNHTMVFSESATGVQLNRHITGTGATYELTSSNDAGGAYVPTGLAGTWHINWNTGDKVNVTC